MILFPESQPSDSYQIPNFQTFFLQAQNTGTSLVDTFPTVPTRTFHSCLSAEDGWRQNVSFLETMSYPVAA